MSNKFKKFWGKCEILYKGEEFSSNYLVKLVDEYLNKTFNDNSEKITDIFLHSGNVCFDAMLFIYAAVKNIYRNEVDSEMTVNSLKPNDLVIYDKEYKGRVKSERRMFVEITEEYGQKYARLKKDDDTFDLIPSKRWNMIHPYHGTSTKLNGSGIRKKTTIKEQFYEEVLEIETTSEIDTNSVIVISKNRADDIIRNISFRFNGKLISFLEAFTASYYTASGDELNYSGNTSHTDPLLKITSDMSMARELAGSDEYGDNIGLMIIGDKVLNKGITEYESLVKRRSLEYAVISLPINSNLVDDTIEKIDDASVFAITKQLLNSINDEETTTGGIIKQQIKKELEVLKEGQILCHPLDGIIKRADYRKFKNNISAIRYSDYDQDDVTEFIMMAYQLNNLYIKAPYSIKVYENYLTKEETFKKNPKEIIKDLKTLKDKFSGTVKDCCNDIIKYLENHYDNAYDNDEKLDDLVALLNKYYKNNKRGIVVTPKGFDISVLKEYLSHTSLAQYIEASVEFCTPGKVNTKEIYDYIISFEANKFNAEKTINALEIITILYEVEMVFYKKKQKRNNSLMNKVNKASKKYTKLTVEDLDEEIDVSEKDDFDDTDIEELIQSYYLKNEINRISNSYYSKGSHLKSSVKRVIAFTDEQKAYLTKNYKAYAIDENTKEIVIKEVEELAEGDTLVFTKGRGDSLDFVEGVLKELIDNHSFGEGAEEDYRLSRLWKEELLNYLIENNCTATELARKMKKNGAPVNEPAIVSWVSPGSHTVGPQKAESLKQIGLITNNSELIDNYDRVHLACKRIRSSRRSILNTINEAVMRKISGKESGSDAIDKYVFEHIDDLAQRLEIEKITTVDLELPMHMTNKPIMVDM